MYYAHTTENPDKHDWQLLKDHLLQVADLAASFASDFNASEFAYASGILHDIGKYSDKFQKRLEGSPIRVDHSTAGALVAKSNYLPLISRILEYIITGHHGGLQNYGSADSGKGLKDRLNTITLPDYSLYKSEIIVPDLSSFKLKLQPGKKNHGFMLSFYIRMLYSCLVDADSLDTEAFSSKSKSYLRGTYDSLDCLFLRFSEHRVSMKNDGSPINQYRQEIYEQCCQKADLPPQMFSLTVPTGGGKTLSSMAFALNHMKKHGLNRVFYVIPYTSIIEQNAGVFRDIFGEKNVLEHHSNYDPDHESQEGNPSVKDMLKLSSENWDMPVVVTTNVQFFESLFSHKRSRCRKLHNLAKSVIILDEAQMLPIEYLKPCLAALVELVTNYGSTVVICTATQPKIGDLLDVRYHPVEIIQSPGKLYEFFKRVHIRDIGDLDDDELTGRLQNHRQVLCIVNTRKHAQVLYDSLSKTGACYHLSAKMCPVHRRKQLAEIKELLKQGAECRVISTQLIEAGVDIDFPVVYRAMTGIDSIAQAAGRCNREGKQESGDVFIFSSTEKHGKATSWQKRVAEIGEMIVKSHSDILSLPAIEEYFQRLYFYQGDDLDKKKILLSLEEQARDIKDLAIPFETVSYDFQLIEQDTRDLIIPYDEESRSIIAMMKKTGFPGQYARKLQGYSVSIYAQEYQQLVQAGVVDVIDERYHVLNKMSLYSEKTGLLKLRPEDQSLDLLIA